MCFAHYCHPISPDPQRKHRPFFTLLWFMIPCRRSLSMSHFLYSCSRNLRPRTEEWVGVQGANALVCESELLWLRLKQHNDGWIREPGWKSGFGGEVKKHVAMNRKNGVKRSLNDKRAKAQTWMEGQQEPETQRGSERRINARTVSGFCVYDV